MDSARRGRRRAALALVVTGGTLALGLAGQSAIAAPERVAGPQIAADKPDCNKNPDACKVVSVGQDARRKARISRKGKARCQSWQFERYGKSAVGLKLWSYYLDVRWCYRRGRITEASANPYPETHVPLWSFNKHLAFRKTGGKRKKAYRVFAQGQFQLCVTKLGCIQDRNPWINVTARGNGTHDYDAGG
jgi:hypothetical protein